MDIIKPMISCFPFTRTITMPFQLVWVELSGGRFSKATIPTLQVSSLKTTLKTIANENRPMM